MTNQTSNQDNPLSNLEPNSAAALAYLIPPITGIAFFLVEKKNKFIRFHSFQSILFGIVLYALGTVVGSLRRYFIGDILAPLVSLSGFALWLYLMWEAYNGREYELPYLGKIAKDQTNK
jgi:uncharacterized membrane protein